MYASVGPTYTVSYLGLHVFYNKRNNTIALVSEFITAVLYWVCYYCCWSV